MARGICCGARLQWIKVVRWPVAYVAEPACSGFAVDLIVATLATGGSCYNIHLKSIFHKICKIEIFIDAIV